MDGSSLWIIRTWCYVLRGATGNFSVILCVVPVKKYGLRESVRQSWLKRENHKLNYLTLTLLWQVMTRQYHVNFDRPWPHHRSMPDSTPKRHTKIPIKHRQLPIKFLSLEWEDLGTRLTRGLAQVRESWRIGRLTWEPALSVQNSNWLMTWPWLTLSSSQWLSNTVTRGMR